MRFKTLKHKTQKDTWGVFMQGQIFSDKSPCLLSLDTTMESLKDIMMGSQMASALEQIKEYELVEVILYEAGKVKIPVEYLTYKDGTKEFYAQLKHWQSLSIGKDRNTIFSMLREKLEELIPSLTVEEVNNDSKS